MTPTASTSPVRALRARLGRLRRHIRALFAFQGVARWITAAVIALVLFFLADWLLDLPIGVRRFIRLGILDRPEGLATLSWLVLLAAAAFLAISSARRRLGAAPVFAFAFAGIGGVLCWLAVRLFRPVAVELPDEELALSVEQRFRNLGDRLAAALDFEEELANPTRGESETMMRVVLDEAEAEARGLRFVQAISGRRALAWMGGALGALALAGAIAWAAPATVELWARRSLLLEERTWPRATTVLAVDVLENDELRPHDPATPYEVAIGRPLLVRATANGRVPDEIVLVDRVAGARALPRRMFPVPDREGLFQIEIRDVRQAFDFVLNGGDDVDDEPIYRVVITVPPRVLALRARLAFPAYLAREPEEVEGGTLSVPEGTEVTVRFETDVAVAEAKAFLQDDLVPTRSVGEDDKHFTFAFTATQSTRYRILLRTPEGRESDPAADTYDVRVVADAAPRLLWLQPRAPVETTQLGRVPLIVQATDDHGVERLDLEVRLEAEETRSWRLVPWTDDAEAAPAEDGELRATDGPLARREVRAYVPLELASLTNEAGQAPMAPARLAARVLAWDSKGQVKEGAWIPIDIYGEVDQQRALADRRAVVRSRINAVLVEQRSRRAQLADLAAGPMGDPERDLLRSIQFAQAKIAQDTDRAVLGLIDIFNSWIYGRLGAQTPTERVLGMLDRHHRRTYGVRETDEAVSSVSLERGDPVFPYTLYDEILEAWRKKVIFDTGLLDRMLIVLDEAVDAAARLAPTAHETVMGAVNEEIDLQTSIEAQDALIASLDRVIDAMRSWQSLNDVILQLRRILEEQEALNDLLDPNTND